MSRLGLKVRRRFIDKERERMREREREREREMWSMNFKHKTLEGSECSNSSFFMHCVGLLLTN